MPFKIVHKPNAAYYLSINITEIQHIIIHLQTTLRARSSLHSIFRSTAAFLAKGVIYLIDQTDKTNVFIITSEEKQYKLKAQRYKRADASRAQQK